MTSSLHARAFGGSRPYPQIDWILATNFRHLPQGQWLPIVVEYDLKAAPNTEVSQRWFADLNWLDPDLHSGVSVPPVFKDPPKVLQKKPFPFCTLLVHRDFLSRIVLDKGWNRTILQAEVGPPVSDEAARDFVRAQPDLVSKEGR